MPLYSTSTFSPLDGFSVRTVSVYEGESSADAEPPTIIVAAKTVIKLPVIIFFTFTLECPFHFINSNIKKSSLPVFRLSGVNLLFSAILRKTVRCGLAYRCVVLLYPVQPSPRTLVFAMHCAVHLHARLVLACLALSRPVLLCLGLSCPILPYLALPCSVLLCLALPWSVLLCLHCPALSCTVLLCPALSCSALFCLALPCSVLLCLALPWSVLLCPALPCSVLLCLALSCSVLLCLALSWSTLLSSALTPALPCTVACPHPASP